MGSVGNQNPWAPYNNYKECTQGVCSIYCPQFCYFIFPPPPPENDSAAPFSPLIIAVIGVLASVFLLVSYYAIVTRYCKGRRNRTTTTSPDQTEPNLNQFRADSASGLDEALIKKIAVCKFVRGDGLIEGSECAVCLSEFEENEPLRLLPKCSHAFHLPCIDTWLRSHSNCPLCRAHVVVLANHLPIAQSSSSPPPLYVDPNQDRALDELVLTVDDREIVSPISDNRSPFQDCDENAEVVIKEVRSEKIVGSDQEAVFRRSISLGTFPFQRNLLISDVLKFEEIDDLRVEKNRSCKGIGCSKGFAVEERKSSGGNIKRSFSSGACIFTVRDKGKSSVLPH
ncbi:hypothetical protein ACP275_14G164200 [Erythranthe tilingii]